LTAGGAVIPVCPPEAQGAASCIQTLKGLMFVA